jgi:O-antigen ligase
MVQSLPFLAYGLLAGRGGLLAKLLLFAAAFAAALGVFLSAGRYPVVLLGLSVALYLVLAPLSVRNLVVLALLIAGVGVLVALDPRLQRFTLLAETDQVAGRVQQSANEEFLDLLREYPVGAGLGRAWGTSIPSFLQDQALPQIGLENEYSRILVEQGLVGLVLWVAFLVWVFWAALARLDRLQAARLFPLAAVGIVVWGTGFISPGLMTGIPTAALLMLTTGVVAQLVAPARSAARPGLRGAARLPARLRPAPALRWPGVARP